MSMIYLTSPPTKLQGGGFITAKKLPSGSWRCQVYDHTEEILQPDGTIKKKRIYKSFTCDDKSQRGKRTCERAAAEWAESKGTRGPSCGLLFGDAVEAYISAREQVLSPSTIRDYHCTKRNYLALINNKSVSEITQADIQLVINAAAAAVSPKTVRNIHGLITAVMGAFRPDFQIRTDLPQKVRPDMHVPTDAEVQRLMEIAKGTEMELPILLAAFGPMRRGEICALETKNISGNTVHVCQNMVLLEDNTWTIKSPKTYAGDRYIEYPDFVAEKWVGIDGRITELNPTMITHRFRVMVRSAGIPPFRFHDLRHYSASVQHALGIPDVYIMQRGGWGSDGTLKSVYRHAMDDKAEEMSKKANKHFSELMQHEVQHGK